MSSDSDFFVDSLAEWQAIRRDLHQHPELSYEEYRTSQAVAERLASWGIEVHTGLAGTGVVGVLRHGTLDKTLGLRADMDALPIQETNTFSHASRQPGKMHACGHDGHTTILLAAARYLSQTRRFNGAVHFIFQPAEERGAGAQRMIQEGLFERFPCDAIFGLHNWPGIPAGHFGVRSGPLMAGTNGFDIRVVGKGAHAAMPHLGVDPILVACHIAQALQLLVSREKKPVDTAVLSITKFHAGDAYNVIPNEATLGGTVRVYDLHVRDRIEEGMRRIGAQIGAAFHATVDVDFRHGYPPVINHSREAAFAAEVMREVVGTEAVNTDIEPSMAAEDFAYYLLERPGCFAFLGNGDGDHRLLGHGEGPCMLHNPSYDFNDDLIPVGARYFARLAERWLA